MEMKELVKMRRLGVVQLGMKGMIEFNRGERKKTALLKILWKEGMPSE